jgi:uncharacterized protein YkwD
MKFSIATVVFGSALAWMGTVFGASTIAPTRAELSAEAAIAETINTARAMRVPNAPHLKDDPVLTEIARARSRAMADGVPFSHQDSQGR